MGDELRLASGEPALVAEVREEDAREGESFTTYNFEVANYHTYFAGAKGVWVHNDGGLCGDIFRLYTDARTKFDSPWDAFAAVVDQMPNKTPSTAFAWAAIDAAEESLLSAH